jgi:hypothetical protein
MRQEGEVRVTWNRAELTAIKEAIEITPNFIGRLEARDVVKAALKSPRHKPVEFERTLAETLANRIVPIDQPTAMARAKLLMAVRGPKRRPGFQPPRPVLQVVPSSVSAAA